MDYNLTAQPFFISSLKYCFLYISAFFYLGVAEGVRGTANCGDMELKLFIKELLEFHTFIYAFTF